LLSCWKFAPSEHRGNNLQSAHSWTLDNVYNHAVR
jgi:hypothetical protein